MEVNRIVLPMGNGLVLQVIMNIVPFLGVVFFDWSVFALIYAFWLETLSESFFNAVRIGFAQNTESTSGNFYKALRYFIIRVLILLFYLIFILVFVGIAISGKQEGINFAMYLLLADPSFKVTIITFFLIKVFELAYHYFYLNERKNVSPNSFTGLFDARIIIIHVVIVLGVFAHQFFSEKMDNHAGVVAFAGVFVLVKTMAELVSNYVKNNLKTE